MEIKSILNKPYTEQQKLDFIVQYNHHQACEIKETVNGLEAWGNTEEENAQNAKLQKIQKIKEELDNFDKKRIRAICENEIKDEETGETWLDFYNKKIIQLREELSLL